MIYGWGEGIFGQLGNSESNDSCLPKPVKAKGYENLNKEESKHDISL
jgi:hypothetical protein